MEISHQTQKETDIVQLRGELDMFNSPELGTFLRGKIESGSKAVLVEPWQKIGKFQETIQNRSGST